MEILLRRARWDMEMILKSEGFALGINICFTKTNVMQKIKNIRFIGLAVDLSRSYYFCPK